MLVSNKTLVIGSLVLVGVGGFAGRLLTPTKTITKTETKVVTQTDTKVVHDKVYVTKTENIVKKPDGTVQDTITTVDQSQIVSNDVSASKSVDNSTYKEITNPKNLSLGVVYKQQVTNITLGDYLTQQSYANVGVVGIYQTQILSTFILGGFFLDGTAIAGVGFTF